jgi:NAD+ synthase (glutamine-hydrolysing)
VGHAHRARIHGQGHGSQGYCHSVRIALCQTNPTIGAVEANTAEICRYVAQAQQVGAELAIFCEQAIIGYPAKDLLLRREVVDRNLQALNRIATAAGDLPVIVGFAEPNPAPTGRPLYNSAALLQGGKTLAVWRKRLLPTYDVFDESRYFETAGMQSTCELNGYQLGVSVCEDLLAEPMLGKRLYLDDPLGDLTAAGATLQVNISASPFVLGKPHWRRNLIRNTAQRITAPLLYVNQVGGNDDLLFDGNSCAVSADGELIAQGPGFKAKMTLVDLARPSESTLVPLAEGVATLRDALVMGVRDYLRKCHFQRAVIGLSGGIDSAVTAALAVMALGCENVRGVAMPSRYSSDHSVADARQLAANLGIRFDVIEIEPIHSAYESQLSPLFAGQGADVAEENIQARARGGLLMALSNKFRALLLTTGNKSELAVGYCTLYGDMAGGLAVISDVPKTMVYQLARFINADAGRELIPANTISKPPSAELKPDQFDQDSLPPYEVLDEILERCEERLETREQIVSAGFEPGVVDRVLRLIRLNEYKRQQAAPGLKVTSKAFGFGRRMPIAADAEG